MATLAEDGAAHINTAYFASDDSELVTGAVLEMEQFPLGGFPDF